MESKCILCNKLNYLSSDVCDKCSDSIPFPNLDGSFKKKVTKTKHKTTSIKKVRKISKKK